MFSIFIVYRFKKTKTNLVVEFRQDISTDCWILQFSNIIKVVWASFLMRLDWTFRLVFTWRVIDSGYW